MKISKLAFNIALVISGSLAASALAAETSPAESAIRQSAQKFVEAYDKGDAETIAALWTPDGEYAIGSKSVKGREAIAKLYGEFFQTHPGSKMEVKIDSIRLLAPTVAIEQGTASLGQTPNNPATSSAYTAIHVKEGTDWLMTSVRESEAPSIASGAGLSELNWLVGDWAGSGDETKVEIKYEWMADKHFLRGETLISENGKTKTGGTEIIGRDPASGQFMSWYFSSDGGHGYGEWMQDGARWVIGTVGMSADGTPTSATNILYHADDNVTSWQSINRVKGNMQLPDAKEVVIERVSEGRPGAKQ